MKLITNMILLLSALFIATAQAEDEEATAPNEEVIYVELKPAFVTNYQSHKMGYLKADVTLQVPCCDKFKDATGWEPEIPYSQTLGDMLNYWRDRVARGLD